MNINEILLNPWISGICITIIATLILYYLFGIGKNDSGNKKLISTTLKGKDIEVKGDIITGGNKIQNNYSNYIEANTVKIKAYCKRIKNTYVIELVNVGNTSLVDMVVTISWEQEDGKHSRVLSEFLPKGADIVMGHPFSENIIKPDQGIWALGIPHSTMDDKLRIEVNGKNAVSDQDFKETSTITRTNKTNVDIVWI